MSARAQGLSVSQDEHLARAHKKPGGWQDELTFGYMFRVIAAVVAIVIPAIILAVYGAFNEWTTNRWMPWIIGAIGGIIVLIGEWLRVSVYELKSTDKRVRSKSELDYINVNHDEFYGFARPKSNLYFAIKRVIDVTCSTVAIILIFPLILLIGVMIKFDSRGPVFSSNVAFGFGGDRITIFKFRTLTATAGQGIESGALNHAQLTRVGAFLRKTALQDLPLLFNVLIGSMSLVGPRPAIISEALENSANYSEISSFFSVVKPGITGVGLLSKSPAESLAIYIENRSTFMDIGIILRTMIRAYYNPDR